MTCRRQRILPVGLLFSVSLMAQAIAQGMAQAMAPVLITIHNFSGSPGDGSGPTGGVVIGSGGVLYGTTYSGGAYGASWTGGLGTVFSLSPPADPGGPWTETLVSFSNGVGVNPYAGVTIGANGVLYGTTFTGFTVFSVRPPTTPGDRWVEVIGGGGPVVLYPQGALAIGRNGVLYGTSNEGGSTFDEDGSVFSVTPPTSAGSTWTTAAIHTFSIRNNDGYYPESGVVIGAGGVLYGTTSQYAQNGNGGGAGTVYALAPPATPGGTWTETILHLFGNDPGDGAGPDFAGVVIGGDGVLYGTTTAGGTGTACRYGCGTVYSLTPPASPGGAWAETVLYSFAGGSDGVSPNGVAIGRGGVLYGTTAAGGMGISCSGGCGTIFTLIPPATPGGRWTERVLHDFAGGDGANPVAGVAIGRDGTLYGTTSIGGTGSACSGGCGTVYELKLF